MPSDDCNVMARIAEWWGGGGGEGRWEIKKSKEWVEWV